MESSSWFPFGTPFLSHIHFSTWFWSRELFPAWLIYTSWCRTWNIVAMGMQRCHSSHFSNIFQLECVVNTWTAGIEREAFLVLDIVVLPQKMITSASAMAANIGGSRMSTRLTYWMTVGHVSSFRFAVELKEGLQLSKSVQRLWQQHDACQTTDGLGPRMDLMGACSTVLPWIISIGLVLSAVWVKTQWLQICFWWLQEQVDWTSMGNNWQTEYFSLSNTYHVSCTLGSAHLVSLVCAYLVTLTARERGNVVSQNLS